MSDRAEHAALKFGPPSSDTTTGSFTLDFWGHADVSFHERYHLQGIPASIYIDANGVVRPRTIGVETVQDIIQSVQALQSR